MDTSSSFRSRATGILSGMASAPRSAGPGRPAAGRRGVQRADPCRQNTVWRRGTQGCTFRPMPETVGFRRCHLGAARRFRRFRRRWRGSTACGRRAARRISCRRSAIISARTPTSALTRPAASSSTPTGRRWARLRRGRITPDAGGLSERIGRRARRIRRDWAACESAVRSVAPLIPALHE